MVPSKACGSAKSTKWIQTQQGASGGLTSVWTRTLTHFFAFMLLRGDQGYLSVCLDMCVWKYNYPSLINLQTESSIHCKSLKQTSLFIFTFFFFWISGWFVFLLHIYEAVDPMVTSPLPLVEQEEKRARKTKKQRSWSYPFPSPACHGIPIALEDSEGDTEQRQFLN